ncbi:plasmodesmata-located protein 8 [Tasmannia lanceolata]|uniref:plasmodesmata-located protein 8 n=1 Tax=Tasmannia lanceolata TaxID=3420 RepID=UPI0040648964
MKSIHKHSLASTIKALKFSSSLFFLLTFLYSFNHQAKADLFIYGGCSQAKFQTDSPFNTNLKSLLSSITNSSSQFSYNSFALGNGSSAPSDGAVYGLYQCRGDLSIPNCANCVQNAVGQLELVCVNAYEAGLQLDSCYVRYENSDFLGKPDMTLMYKKCSTTTSNDAEFFKRRDDVLSELQTGLSFKVSSLGMVQGFAQCLGDLSSGDCSSCLVEAVGRLKNVCGSALAADVYLAQCYARYWAPGYYSPSTDSTSEDEVGRTVAIIVGALAGLAVVIVLLSFLRKALG